MVNDHLDNERKPTAAIPLAAGHFLYAPFQTGQHIP